MRPLCVPSRTRVLENGMRVVVHEDHSSPVVAVHLMYHTGSRHERPRRTGLAHLLEHLMFEGSEHCPKGEFDTLLEAVGGTNNGSTWLDRTNYYETVPSHAVELALWLERDRMAHFLPVLSEQMLETQRGVVMNERLQAYENRPYGLADQRLHELLYPAEHPYSWPTIGYMEDLEEIQLDDVRRFHQNFYTPANAVLVLAGDITHDSGFALAQHYFGDLPAGRAAGAGTAEAAGGSLAASERRETMADRVSFPRIYRAVEVPAYGTPDWIALDLLAYLLADGESSLLQRRLVRERELAQDVEVYLYPTELSAVFGVVATARSRVPIEAIEAEIDSSLASVAERGVTPDELAGAVRRVRRDQVSGLAQVEERAEALAFAATVLGDAGRLESVLAGYLEVTPEDISRVADEYVVRNRSAKIIVTPASEENRGE